MVPRLTERAFEATLLHTVRTETETQTSRRYLFACPLLSPPGCWKRGPAAGHSVGLGLGPACGTAGQHPASPLPSWQQTEKPPEQ